MKCAKAIEFRFDSDQVNSLTDSSDHATFLCLTDHHRRNRAFSPRCCQWLLKLKLDAVTQQVTDVGCYSVLLPPVLWRLHRRPAACHIRARLISANEIVFTVRLCEAYTHGIAVDILYVCPSVRLSVCQTRVL